MERSDLSTISDLQQVMKQSLGFQKTLPRGQSGSISFGPLDDEPVTIVCTKEMVVSTSSNVYFQKMRNLSVKRRANTDEKTRKQISFLKSRAHSNIS